MGRSTLSGAAETTRRLHLRYALLEAFALGIMANAPIVALRSLGAPPWQLALALIPSSVGIFLDLYIGSRMARASKIPYVQGAIGVFACAVAVMSVTTDPLLFNALHGIGNLGQIIAQMALGGVVRAAYPPAVRGAIAGRVRRFAALAFFAGAGGAALIIELATRAGHELPSARVMLALASVLALIGAFGLRRMPIDGGYGRARGEAPGLGAALANARRIVTTDVRFRRYIGASIASALGGLMVSPFVKAFLVRDLGLAYLATVAIATLLPKSFAFATTEAWGRLIDGRNPWGVWAGIRTLRGSSFVLLGAAAASMSVSPMLALSLAIVSKAMYGAVMGGSWILYWQLGVAHFARPGADTSRYMGLITAVSGSGRLIAPSIGALIVSLSGAVVPVFFVGGSISLLSAYLCARGLRLDGDEPRYRTIAAFEASAADDEEGS